MQSTQISENIESFQLDETKDRSEEVMTYFSSLIYQTKNEKKIFYFILGDWVPAWPFIVVCQ